MTCCEVWKDIPGYSDRYQASNLGRIRSKTRGVLHQWVGDRGYSMVTIRQGGGRTTPSVHRLVASAFIPNPKDKPMVNHKNGIKTDNRVENLEWATASENVAHGKNILGHRSGGKTPRQVRCVSTGQLYASLADAARDTGATVSGIWACCNGKQMTAACLIWQYERVKE